MRPPVGRQIETRPPLSVGCRVRVDYNGGEVTFSDFGQLVGGIGNLLPRCESLPMCSRQKAKRDSLMSITATVAPLI